MLIYNGYNYKINTAVDIARKLLDGEKGFYQFVLSYKFKNTTAKNSQIVEALKSYNDKKITVVKEYWKWNPFSSEQAYFDPRKPNAIHLNKWKYFRKSIPEFVASIVHEFIHCADNYEGDLEFTHTYHWHKDRKDSVPYAIGRIAENLAKAYYGSL